MWLGEPTVLQYVFVCMRLGTHVGLVSTYSYWYGMYIFVLYSYGYVLAHIIAVCTCNVQDHPYMLKFVE
jgi:hypothetical protein